jgi:hypothetical protein
VCGNEEGLQRLANVLQTLEDANAKPVSLHLLPFVQTHGDVELTALPMDWELGVCRISSGPCFEWHHSREGWLESAEKIKVVARGIEGHCCLGETPANDLVVMVSKGEYDDAWWQKHD